MSQFRWGILGTGVVARKFVQGLRASQDGEAALIVSRSAETARQFARDLGIPRATGSLDEAVRDRSIDAFYVATPASAHRDQAIFCLDAGRPVLVEKPFALDAAQARDIVAAARARSVFCMEAMWTRFLPLVGRLRQTIEAGAIGEVRALTGSFCIAEARTPGKSLYDPALGGGALLHRGVYPISLAFHLLGAPDRILSDAAIGETGVDEEVAVILGYDRGAHALLRASLRTHSTNDFTVEGTRGRIHVQGPLYCPFRMTLTPFRERGPTSTRSSRIGALKENRLVRRLYQRVPRLASPFIDRRATHLTIPYAGNGYHYEADEVMRCVRQGRHESAVMPLSESLSIMEAMDSIRVQWPGAPAREQRALATG